MKPYRGILSRFIYELERIKSRDYLIIVEGKKDKLALEELGLKNIFILHEKGRSLYERVEEIFALKKEVVFILTDLDKKGRMLYIRIKQILSENGVRLNDSLRYLLYKLRVTHVEGLSIFLNNYYKNSSKI